MPKRAVAIYLGLGLLGAMIFVYFTFPRTRAEIPQSNNQRPYPSSPGPNGVPLPESVPHPTAPPAPVAPAAPPVAPHGPTLRVMAWATPDEAAKLQAEADAFGVANGVTPVLRIDGDEASYRRDLLEAMISETPPDVCLVAARDFSGLDPVRVLAEAESPGPVSPRSAAAFVVDGRRWAVPDEFSVDMLFYHPADFDRAGIAYPDRHWTWDIMEAITRALESLQMKNGAGERIYPLELPADFDFWNILCTQAGHPALDRDRWHLTDLESRDSHLRGLDLIHEFFRDLNVTAPADKVGAAPGRYFAKGLASLLIAPSEFEATPPGSSPFEMTLLPSDISRASLARVNGWAVTGRSSQPAMAAAMAHYLSGRPLHAGWSSVRKPAATGGREAPAYEALEQSLLPRLEPKTERLAELLDQQINLFAAGDQAESSADLYAAIQAEYQAGYAPRVPVKPPNLNKASGVEIRDF